MPISTDPFAKEALVKSRTLLLPIAFSLLAASAPLLAHCEIPCGVYGDDARFAALEEDLTTIEKAMMQIAALAGQTDAQSANQLARWVATKEDHANKIQRVVAQYFMTQRLKEVEEGDEAVAAYTGKLVLLHKMLRGAMRCKQTVDLEQVEKMRALLHEFKHTYQN